MEREGREEGKMRRRGKGEMRKGRRGIIVGGMILSLLLGCNNGGEDPQKVFLKSVVSLGSNFLDVFTYFGDMLGDVLGFSEKTTKSEVGTYFTKVKDTVEGVKSKLNTMVESMKAENNPNASKTSDAVTALNGKLTQIIEGASKVKEAIGDDSNPIGNVVTGATAGAKGENVEGIVKGIKSIVEVVLQGKGDAQAGDANGPVTDSAGAVTARDTNGDARQLFANDTAGSGAGEGAKMAKDATKAVGAVTGADILKAMAQDDGKAAKLAANDSYTKSNIAASIAGVKDAEVAGGIALRAMAKKGKFSSATSDTADTKKTVEKAAVSAVIKALDTLTIAIRKTIDEGLKEVKKAMKINPDDTSITSETGAAAK